MTDSPSIVAIAWRIPSLANPYIASFLPFSPHRTHIILVLEQGQIVESGTHKELLALERRYARFYAQQFS
ncbi:hypothetical protein [Nostoc sp.]|uniref:hypothetical protein n=1 Tax=Nostoc sp. TaxID=1180 RepID=UPI002FF5AC57